MNRIRFIEDAYLLKRKQEMLFKPILQQYGLRQSELDVLICLHENDDCSTAKSICARRLLPKSLISQSVVTLTERGLIESRVDAADRRRMLLTLLPAALPIIAEADAVNDRLCERLLSGMSEAEAEILLRALETLSRNIRGISPDEDTPASADARCQ